MAPAGRAGCVLSQRITTTMHATTHIDAPAHVVQGTPFIDEVPLPHFFGSGIVQTVTTVAPCAVLVHGLGRTAASMALMGGALSSMGYVVVNKVPALRRTMWPCNALAVLSSILVIYVIAVDLQAHHGLPTVAISAGWTVARLSWLSNPPSETKNTCRLTFRLLRAAISCATTLS